jgi:hypothetical protein
MHLNNPTKNLGLLLPYLIIHAASTPPFTVHHLASSLSTVMAIFFSFSTWHQPNRLVFFPLLLSLEYAGYPCPMPECSACLPAEVHDAPGVGFDLTIYLTQYLDFAQPSSIPSYALQSASAVHMYNGSIADAAKVPAKSGLHEAYALPGPLSTAASTKQASKIPLLVEQEARPPLYP